MVREAALWCDRNDPARIYEEEGSVLNSLSEANRLQEGCRWGRELWDVKAHKCLKGKGMCGLLWILKRHRNEEEIVVFLEKMFWSVAWQICAGICVRFHNWICNKYVAWLQDWPKLGRVNQDCSIYPKLREGAKYKLQTVDCKAVPCFNDNILLSKKQQINFS